MPTNKSNVHCANCNYPRLEPFSEEKGSKNSKKTLIASR